MPSVIPVWVTPKLSLPAEAGASRSPSKLVKGKPTSSSIAVHLTIFGRPTTKKTKNQVAMVGGRPRVFPSKKWRQWVDDAVVEFHTPCPLFPLKENVNCRALFYRERNAGDPVGYYQALADFLETCLVCRRRQCSCNKPIRLLSDDKWLHSWDGSRVLKDKENPRVEVFIARFKE